jgi:hypothetical protein
MNDHDEQLKSLPPLALSGLATGDQVRGTDHFTLEKPCRKRRRNRRGAAVVEFAVVAPIFVALVLGMIEFGRALMVQQTLTNASREGARVAVLEGATASEVTAAVEDRLTTISGATVACDPDPSAAAYGDSITVTVSVPFNGVSWLPTPIFLGGEDLTASTVMRVERVQ